MTTSCSPQSLVLDEDGYAHGPYIVVPMDNGGEYQIKGMTSPHSTGRHVTISSHGGSRAVSSISISATSCYVHWLDNSTGGTVMWHYDGIDGDAILWHFLMTLSLGSTGNLVKRTATDQRNCDRTLKEETLSV